MAAVVQNSKITRYADMGEVGVWIFEEFAGWEIESEWIMSTGCEVMEFAKEGTDGVIMRETIYIWP
jgi:hypothetical protein